MAALMWQWLYWEGIDSWMHFPRMDFPRAAISARVVSVSRENWAKLLLSYDPNQNYFGWK